MRWEWVGRKCWLIRCCDLLSDEFRCVVAVLDEIGEIGDTSAT